MSDREHGRTMLEKARDDLNALRGMAHPSLFGTDFFSDEIFGFHAQQAVEKALKAWLSFCGRTYPRTHDLMTLIQELDAMGEDVNFLDELLELNPFAVQYRYETMDDDEEEPMDRQRVLADVGALLSHVAQQIGA